MSDETTVALSDDNFQSEVLESDTLVVVDFWAPWCQPCKAIAPILDELAEEYKGKLKIGKYNVEEQTKYAVEHGIRQIPALLFFKDGKLADSLLGNLPKSTIAEKVDRVLEA